MRRAFKPQSESAASEPAPAGPGWTKQELLDAVHELGGVLSPKTFDTIRKAARVRGPSHGGRNHVFSAEDLLALIDKAESGRFTERGPVAAAAWRSLAHQGGVQVPDKLRRGGHR